MSSIPWVSPASTCNYTQATNELNGIRKAGATLSAVSGISSDVSDLAQCFTASGQWTSNRLDAKLLTQQHSGHASTSLPFLCLLEVYSIPHFEVYTSLETSGASCCTYAQALGTKTSCSKCNTARYDPHNRASSSQPRRGGCCHLPKWNRSKEPLLGG